MKKELYIYVECVRRMEPLEDGENAHKVVV